MTSTEPQPEPADEAAEPPIHTPAWALACTACLIDAKQAAARGLPQPEILPALVMFNGNGLCEQRHQIQVEPPKLLLAQPGQMPPGMLN